VVLDPLAAVAPPFVPGSTVGLSDGTRGVVVDVDVHQPYQPKIKRVEADGRLASELLTPGRDSEIQIRRIGDTEVRPLLDELAMVA
jgi:hypothetical protein